MSVQFPDLAESALPSSEVSHRSAYFPPRPPESYFCLKTSQLLKCPSLCPSSSSLIPFLLGGRQGRIFFPIVDSIEAGGPNLYSGVFFLSSTRIFNLGLNSLRVFRAVTHPRSVFTPPLGPLVAACSSALPASRVNVCLAFPGQVIGLENIAGGLSYVLAS